MIDIAGDTMQPLFLLKDVLGVYVLVSPHVTSFWIRGIY